MKKKKKRKKRPVFLAPPKECWWLFHSWLKEGRFRLCTKCGKLQRRNHGYGGWSWGDSTLSDMEVDRQGDLERIKRETEMKREGIYNRAAVLAKLKEFGV